MDNMFIHDGISIVGQKSLSYSIAVLQGDFCRIITIDSADAVNKTSSGRKHVTSQLIFCLPKRYPKTCSTFVQYQSVTFETTDVAGDFSTYASLHFCSVQSTASYF